VAQETRSTVDAARGLVSDLDTLLQDSNALDDRIRHLTKFAALQGVLLIGVAFVAAILYQLVAVRMIKPR